VSHLRLVIPACMLLSCLRGEARLGGEHGNHICGPGENYRDVPEDCFDTPFVMATSPHTSVAEAPGWHARQGVCLVDGYDRLAAGNGICELQESLWFRADCEPTCGNGTIEGDDETRCIADWLKSNRDKNIGPKLCATDDETNCCNEKVPRCEGEEDACNCPEDCGDPEDYPRVNGGTGETTSTTDSETTTGETDSGSESSSEESSTTMVPPECNNVCDKEAEGCPEDCFCGDGVVYGDEDCDNGQNKDPLYSPIQLPPGACAPGCLLVGFCGDSLKNGPESCDAGGAQTDACEADCRAPDCGDGTLNTMAGETCDDGNDIDCDSCSKDCAIERRVFVTQADYTGNLGGIFGADEKCDTEVGATPGTYKAWLSDDSMSPASRFDKEFKGNYCLASKVSIATGWLDLVDGTLNHRINIDHTGEEIIEMMGSNVWTNTNANGMTASATSHCVKWSSTMMGLSGLGKTTDTESGWTKEVGYIQPCSSPARLYCFEDPN